MAPLDEVNLTLVDNFDDCSRFFRWVGEQHANDAIAFDTETESLSPYDGSRIRLIQLGDTRFGWAFPPEWHGAALQILNDWKNELVAHNAKFDVNWLRQQYGWKPPWLRIHDTISIAHIDDPTRTRGLKPLSGMLIDSRAATSQKILDDEMSANGWNWKTIPIRKEGVASSYWIYGALDPVLTCMLFDHFKSVRSQFREAYELEMGTVRCIADMERRGARVDLDYCRLMMRKIEEYSKAVRSWIFNTHGIHNATSNPQCISRFKELGRQITHFTESGRDSLNKDQLKTFLAEEETAGDDLAQALLDLRRGEKFTGPYFSNFNEMADANSIVHPTIWPVGTRTARMSISSPALQTLPRKDPTVRDAFIPSEGNSMITIDANQIEMRLAAHFSQDTGLRDAFLGEEDFFNVVASNAYGTNITKDDPRRQTIKNASYAKLYTAGNEKIAATAGVPLAQIETLMATFDSMYPGIQWLQNACEAAGKSRSADGERPYVCTPTGRRMYTERRNERVLVNYLIQSHAAEVLKKGICELDAAGIGEYLILPVHDELVLDVPNEDVDDVKHHLKGVLDGVGENYFVPLTWDADVMADRWGTKYRK